jgi:hypothetical protein
MTEPAQEIKPKREREEITLDTVVPEVPKKAQRVAKPVYEDLVKQLKAVDEQIANANQKMKIFIQDVIQGVKVPIRCHGRGQGREFLSEGIFLFTDFRTKGKKIKSPHYLSEKFSKTC